MMLSGHGKGYGALVGEQYHVASGPSDPWPSRKVLAMTDDENQKRVLLRQFLVASYIELRRRLVRRRSSDELASEVLHEAYLRLDQRDTDVQRPNDYILRVALNIANDKRRSDNRRLTYSEVEALYHFADAIVDGEREVESRSELA